MTCRDRALQLEPDNPLLWWSMAEASFDEGRAVISHGHFNFLSMYACI